MNARSDRNCRSNEELRQAEPPGQDHYQSRLPDPSQVREVCEQVRNAIKAERSSLTDLFVGVTGYSRIDAAELLDAAFHFLSRLPQLSENLDRKWRAENESLPKLWPTHIGYEPLGRCLICLPSNAAIPLAIILPVCFCLAGNSVILSASSKTKSLVERLVRLLPFTPDQLRLWTEGSRKAVHVFVPTKEVDMLYFLGPSAPYPGWASLCAQSGVELIYEGEGNSITVIDPELTEDGLDVAFASVFRSKARWNGQMCSSPNVVVIDKKAEQHLIDWTNDNAQSFRFAELILQNPTVEYIYMLKQKGANAHPAGPMRARIQNPLVVGPVSLTEAVEQELFCPVVAYCTTDNMIEILDAIPFLRHQLQLTIFSDRPEFTDLAVKRTRVARYVINGSSTAQDSALPWGNFGYSGQSQINNFFEKAFRRIIVESPDELLVRS